MDWVIETPRLLLRELNTDDAQFFFDLNNDPEVIRYTGDVAFESIDAARQFLAGYDHFKKYGFGRWAMATKSEHKLVGWCGLKYSSDANEYDLGFRLFKNEWGKDFATEAGIACLTAGFQKFNMPMIVGRALKANIGSIRVLEKCGMRYWKDVEEHDNEAVVYKCFPEDLNNLL